MRVVHWFRSDLRLRDNTALERAAARGGEVVPVFVLDRHLLGGGANRAAFLLGSLDRLRADLDERGCPLVVRRGDPAAEIGRLLGETGAELLTFNRDYSPYAKARDARVTAAARRRGAEVLGCKDRVMFESDEVRTRSGGPFRVYTPYRRAWRRRFRDATLGRGKVPRLPAGRNGLSTCELPKPAPTGAALPSGGEAAARRRLRRFCRGALRDYAADRDRPAVDGTSRLSAHLHLGTVSVRDCLRAAVAAARRGGAWRKSANAWIDQLIWRDFYHALLAEHPRVLGSPFREEYAAVRWNDEDEGFAAWCEGRTGYPFVDAGMRQLVATGWMHNRARMVVASFLVKDLLIDWRRGEAFFRKHLVDGDPANNNGGWQWAASTGTDAQPYFRIFNPSTQGQRFDPDGAYVRRYVPELADVPDRWIHRPWEAPSPPATYPPPIVDHAERRTAAVARFAAARRKDRR